MATTAQILGIVVEQVQGVTPAGAVVAAGWPPIKTLQELAKNGGAIVSVYPLGGAKDTTRWLPSTVSQTIITPGTTVTPTQYGLVQGGSGTFTIGGTPLAGDGVCLGVQLGNFGALSAEYVIAQVASGDTVDTVAAKLVAAVQANTALAPYITATASGADVTIESVYAGEITLGIAIGNGGTNLVEVGRKERKVQVVLWTKTENDREVYGDPIDVQFSALEINFGVNFSDGTYGRVIYSGDQYLEDATFQDLYRRDFYLSVEYPITQQEQLYTVLVQEVSLTLASPLGTIAVL